MTLVVANATINPGVAQLVARLVWDQEAQSSNLCTRTMRSVLIGSENLIKDTLLFLYAKLNQAVCAGA